MNAGKETAMESELSIERRASKVSEATKCLVSFRKVSVTTE